MKTYNSINNIEIKNPILTVGTFDGVHLGHKKILNILVKNAKKLNGEPIVFTLHPHPRKVLFPDNNNLSFLNTINEKEKILENSGIKHFIVYPFTKEFANLSSCDFIKEILYKKLKIKQLIIGYDHHFGKDKQSNFNILKKCCSKYKIEVFKVSAFEKDNVTISSTKIRNELLSGNIELANSYLSYKYNLSGTVISGNKIGRKIGFPTANIEVKNEKLIPSNGVYAVSIIVNNNKYKGMLNIGKRPTINTAKEKTIEVHIFDFKQDIYGLEIKIIFEKFIRNEIKFNNIEDLQKQLIIDKQIIKNKM